MNEQEIAFIQSFLQNPHQFEVVKKFLLSQFNLNDLRAGREPNEVLGQIARARMDGREILEKGFVKLLKYKEVEQTKNKINEAR